jgi:Secretion system C-terminal sorting domain
MSIISIYLLTSYFITHIPYLLMSSMKKIFIYLFALLLVSEAVGQKSQRTLEFLKNNPHAIYGLHKPTSKDPMFMKGKRTFCGLKVIPSSNYRPAPQAYFNRYLNPNARLDGTQGTATFIVDYIGFPPEAQKAFQRAVDIWSALIKSPVPIRIQATWSTDLADFNNDENVLGAANPASWRNGRYFQGALKTSTWYPMALAEKLNGIALNAPEEADIEAIFNGSFKNWYYGDGASPSNQYDFTSVVLHELGHGLGFTGLIGVSGTNGAWGYNGMPEAFDHLVIDGLSQQLINTSVYTNPSENLKTAIESKKLSANSPAAAKFLGTNPKLYAPSPYQGGSSIYHLDEATYGKGNPNELMTPIISGTNRDPGPATLGIFTDMGWKATSIIHTILRDNEDITKPVVFTAKILSDTTVTSVKLNYAVNPTSASNLKFTTVEMTRIGTSNSYSFTLPATGTDRFFVYYFSANDNFGRTSLLPAEAPTKGYYLFTIGADTEAPSIYHDPIVSVAPTDANNVSLEAGIEDNIGLKAVYIEYNINGGTLTKTALTSIDKDQYGAGTYTFKFPSLKLGDKIQYRLSAQDVAQKTNTGYLPSATEFYSFKILVPLATRNSYENDFSSATATDDFVGVSFGISTPTGFSNPCINSDHPYKNGTGPNNESNYLYQLLAPIKLASQYPTIEFDEIVLVEPGEDGSKYGSASFYDFVVIEGSYDGGKSWYRFQDGYDSRSNSDWLAAWNKSGDSDNNSTTVGTPSLFKKRSINMLQNGNFKVGDEVMIRFRLFSDELTHGWGWAIDNLKIQMPPITAVAPEIIEKTDIQVYPNPNIGELVIDAQWKQKGEKAIVTLTDAVGQPLLVKQFDGQSIEKHKIDISSLSGGLYFVTLTVGEEKLVKKVVMTK